MESRSSAKMSVEPLKIPLVDLKAQNRTIQAELQAAIDRVIDTTSFIMGKDVAEFENEFAAFCGVSHVIGVSSGTSALHLALRAIGVSRGDEVITVPHTFIATVEAIIHCGGKPVFVDVDWDSYTLDASKLMEAISPRTRAILPVHLYGQCADMQPILEFARNQGVSVVEDAAQAHGATYHGRKAGTMGEVACFSFYPGKNFGAFGDAGAISTNDLEVAEKVRRLRDHGRKEKYVHQEIGYGERLDTMQAAILRVKLARLSQWNARRREIAALYSEQLSILPNLQVPKVREKDAHVFHLYVIRSPQRDELLDYLKRRGVMAGIHYPVPLHRQPALEAWGYQLGDFPVSEELSRTVLSLPLYPEMTDEQVNRVIQAVCEFY